MITIISRRVIAVGRQQYMVTTVRINGVLHESVSLWGGA